MPNFDMGKLAKEAIQGVTKGEGLSGLAKEAPEQLIEALRKLVAEARQKVEASPNKNEALDACLKKAEELLSSGKVSTEEITKVTAELTALLKSSPKLSAQPAPQARASSPAAQTSAPAKPAAPQQAPAAAKPSVQFSDVKPGAYYYDAVQWAVQQGIATGTSETTFAPDQTCTRAQALTLLWRAAGSPTPPNKNCDMKDVKSDAYYANAVYWAAGKGITSGAEFHPDDPATRSQMTAFLYRSAGSPAVSKPTPYKDVPADADYAKAVAWASEKGIVSGTGEGKFDPDGKCTRGQIVTMLYRAKK